MSNALSTLCLCRRASKLVIGFDAVTEQIKKKAPGGVLLACDISAKTEKEIRFYAEKQGVEILKLPITMEDAKNAAGKQAGVFYIIDEGLFNSIKK